MDIGPTSRQELLRASGADELRAVVDEVVEAGGSIRMLLARLARQPSRVIPGHEVRSVFAAYDIAESLETALPSAHLIDQLDALRIGEQEGRPAVTFEFPEPQTVMHPSALGRVRIEVRPRLQFQVEGDAMHLRPGDVRLHWMLFTEDLRAIFQGPSESSEDVLHLAAGHVFHQTVLLPPLRRLVPAEPDRPALPVPEPVLEQEVAGGPAELIVVLHQAVPGRLRLDVAGLYRNEALGQQLEDRLARRRRIRRASASARTGHLLILFDSAVDAEEVLTWVRELLSGQGGGVAEEQVAPSKPWHYLDASAVVDFWDTDGAEGLSTPLVAARQQQFGPNALPVPQPRSPWRIFGSQFKSLPVMLLGASAVLSLATGGILDAVVILGVVGLNAGIGFVTEQGAEQTIMALSQGIHPDAVVQRDGQEHLLSAEDLVPGDVILLKRGMYVPADARLLITDHLTVDQSALTGESVPVEKQVPSMTQPDVPLGSRHNMVYRGTVVTGGSGRAVVVATGQGTEVGQVQRWMTEVRAPETPLQQQLRILGRQLVGASGVLCSVVVVIGVIRGRALVDVLRTAISLAVAAVPEGLPTVATTTLALGLRRLEAQDVLVRRLEAVETLGALQEICLDKTGTLTLNRMTLVAVHAGGARHPLEADADDEGRTPDLSPAVRQLLELTVLCSEVEVERENGTVHLQGSATETALVQGALDAGIDVDSLRAAHPQRRTRLRSEQRNLMDTLHDHPDGTPLLAVKGRPSEVLTLCDRYLAADGVHSLGQDVRDQAETVNERMAGQALRVLGVAYAEEDIMPEDGGLVWVGLAGIADPPRPGMQRLMQQLHRAGIHTTMITGDQSATAQAIARTIGLGRDGQLQILDSTRLDDLEPDVLRSLAQRVDVFSRVSPVHKLRIVQALQQAGHVVAMTGDGVNDGPALRAADVGIAMGTEGADVAQEVADIIVRDNQLETLIEAIEQGRTIYDDIQKAVHFILASNASEMLLTLTATAAGLGEPLNAMQLLWINLMTDVFPELALGVEPPEADVMQRHPRPTDAPMFDRPALRQIALEGSLITGGGMAAYGWGLARYGAGPHAGTMAFTALTLAQLLHTISCRSVPHSVFDEAPFPKNPYIPMAVGGGISLQVLATLVPGLRSVLGVTRLGVADWSVAALAALAPFVSVELLKVIRSTHTHSQEDVRCLPTTSLPRNP